MTKTARSASGIRLATFNLRHGAPADRYRGDPDKVAEACAGLNADILALQEVDQGTLRSKRADLAALAAEAAGMEVVFSKTMRIFGGSYGNALLVRGEIADVEPLMLMGGHRHRIRFGKRRIWLGHELRGAIIATAHTAIGSIAVAATHLAVERNVARTQLHHIVSELAQRDAPQVLLGDLNLSGEQLLAEPALADMKLVGGPATFPADSPKRRIDHIAVFGLTVQTVTTHQFPISDHRALIADVTLSTPS